MLSILPFTRDLRAHLRHREAGERATSDETSRRDLLTRPPDKFWTAAHDRERHCSSRQFSICTLRPKPHRYSSLQTYDAKTMKFSALPVAAIVAVAASNNLANAANCTVEEHVGAYTRLAVLMSMSSVTQCSEDSGYSLLYSPSLPSIDETARMCASSSCNSMIATILSLEPPNCDLTVATSGLLINVLESSNSFAGLCASMGVVADGSASSFASDAEVSFNSTSSSVAGL